MQDITEQLKEYLWNEWKSNNIPKYHKYFELWFNNLTENQLAYYIAYMNGYKTI